MISLLEYKIKILEKEKESENAMGLGWYSYCLSVVALSFMVTKSEE